MNRFILSLLFTVSVASAQTVADPAKEGPVIVAEAFAKLSGALGAAISAGGPAKALPVCGEEAPRIAKEVAGRHGVTLRRWALRARNPKNRAVGDEQAILEEFSAVVEKKETPSPRVVAHADGSRTFYAPILLQNALCLQCHGTPGREIAPETIEAIRARYPEDEATGFALGDLRGLWAVTFPAAP